MRRCAARGAISDPATSTYPRPGRAARCAAIDGDSVVFSHFVAINAAIGAAIGDDRLVVRSLDNCSVTVFDVVDGALQLVESGHEADTLIR